ncbi:MAG: hypothetical protein AAF653_13210 [Chloroflexota bacterium]
MDKEELIQLALQTVLALAVRWSFMLKAFLKKLALARLRVL